MPNVFERAETYYQSAPSDPWRWAEEGRVVVWADGSTIAFREELAEILEGMVANGLPPFQLVVLLLAACKGKLPPSSENGPPIFRSSRRKEALTSSRGDLLRKLVERSDGSRRAEDPNPTQLVLPISSEPPHVGSYKPWNDPANQDFCDLLARLRLLHQLPAEQKETPRAKTILIESIVEGLSVSRTHPAREIARALLEVPGLNNLNATEDHKGETANAYLLLAQGLKSFSIVSLALRQRTSLDTLPAAAEVELRPSERARQLLALLRTDPEQQGLAKVARDIMAAIYLPRSLSELDELALGGFSDIANRGSLDRLLASELANDDLTLATRIALNEALYIRREPPSNHPPVQLAMLLDVGVRQWGLPRVFATAVALAFIAKEERCTEVSVWRAKRAAIEKADLLSRNGLIEHLSALETYAHPSPALKPFFKQFARQPEMEAVLITHRDCVADPDFQRALSEIDWRRFYIATVDRDGCFELFAHPHRQKPLCQAEIALESLFAQPTGRTGQQTATLGDAKHDPSLPLILNVRPFPFLLPVLGKVEWSHALENGGGVAILRDRRLIRWDSPTKGATTLIEKLPPGKILWLGTTDHGKQVHVLKILTATGVASLTTWNGVSGAISTTDNAELRFWKLSPEYAYERDSILYIVSAREASAWQIDGARFLGKTELPARRLSRHGRYFLGADGEWRFLQYDGTGLRLLRLALPPKLKDLSIVALFDRERFENGPFALTENGNIYSAEGDCISNLGLIKKGSSVGFNSISRDGHRIVICGIAESSPMPVGDFQLIDLWRHSARRISLPRTRNFFQAAAAVLDPMGRPPTRNLRVNFSAISSAPGEELLLRSTKGAWHKLSLIAKELRLTPVQSGFGEPPFVAEFKPVTIPAEFSFRLQMASWPDGSRAWLDSRGMLHLKRANSSTPEVSVVLADGPMAAWSSDGKICGPEFFLHEPAMCDAAELMFRIESFCPVI